MIGMKNDAKMKKLKVNGHYLFNNVHAEILDGFLALVFNQESSLHPVYVKLTIYSKAN
jgi:hypothetical protein